MKFFLILPAVHQQLLIINNEKYIKEIRIIKRYVSETKACLCHIISTERVVSDLHDINLLYLDAIVEIECLLLTPLWMADYEEFNNNDNDDTPWKT